MAGLGVFLLVAPPVGLEGIAQYLLAGAMVGIAVLVVWIFLRPLGGIRGYGRVLRTGEYAAATILEVEDTGVEISHQPAFTFTLEVQRGH